MIRCCIGEVCPKCRMMNAECRTEGNRKLFAFIRVFRGQKTFTKIAQTVEQREGEAFRTKCMLQFAAAVEPADENLEILDEEIIE